MISLTIACLIGTVFAQQTCNVHLAGGATFSDVAKRRYTNLDTDADGHISSGEYTDIMHREDADVDECISYQEFHDHYSTTLLEPYTRKLFDAYDVNNDSCIKEPELLKDFRNMDTNKNGVVEEAEWLSGYTQFLAAAICP